MYDLRYSLKLKFNNFLPLTLLHQRHRQQLLQVSPPSTFGISQLIFAGDSHDATTKYSFIHSYRVKIDILYYEYKVLANVKS